MENVHIFAFTAKTLELVYSLDLNDTRVGYITNSTEITLNGNIVDVQEITNIITSARATVRLEANGEIITRLEITTN